MTDRIAGKMLDYQADLKALEDGELASWTLKMQIMPFEEEKTYRFNPYDAHKVGSHDDYPPFEVALSCALRVIQFATG